MRIAHGSLRRRFRLGGCERCRERSRARIDTSEDARTFDARAFDASLDASSDATTRDATTRDASSDDAEIEDAEADAIVADGPIDAPPDACSTVIYVDAVNGNDTSDGSVAAPFKSITKAIAVSTGDSCISTIRVRPGIYDEANGEVFPLNVPASISLLGDEANKGAGANPTYIHGSAFAYGPVFATMYAGSGSTIAGFEITASQAPDAGSFFPMEILLVDGVHGVTVRNDTINGSGTEIFYGSIGVYVLGSTGNAITDNFVTNNAVGLYNGGGASSRMERNVMSQNQYGFEGDYLGGDLGGGDGGSTGGNVLSCNRQNMWLTASQQPARNNYWDHVPPTITNNNATTADIYLSSPSSATNPDTTGAMLANPSCP